MPLYRKLPHRGFSNFNHRVEFAVVNVGDLAKIDASRHRGGCGGPRSPVVWSAPAQLASRCWATAKLPAPLKVSAAKFSASAKAKIEKAGGQVVIA
jgi:large subunit ribosomal protein L15